MPLFQATERSEDSQRVTGTTRKAPEGSHQAPQANQQPPAQDYTFEEREEAEIKAIKERRASSALHQALRTKEQAAERVAAARREAERQDKILQKRLIDQYGYGQQISMDDPEAIEMSQINVPADFLSKCWGWDSGNDKAEGMVTKRDSAVAQKQEDTRCMDD